MTPTETSTHLLRAKEIESEIMRLRDEQDKLLEPICKEAMGKSDAAIQALIDALPPGFHRTELRTFQLSKRTNGRPQS